MTAAFRRALLALSGAALVLSSFGCDDKKRTRRAEEDDDEPRREERASEDTSSARPKGSGVKLEDVLGLAVPGRPVDKLEAFMNANSAMAKAVKEAAQKDGAAGARKVFDARSKNVKEKFAAIEHLRAFEVGEEMQERLTKNVSDAATDICLLAFRGAPDEANAFEALCEDYMKLLGADESRRR